MNVFWVVAHPEPQSLTMSLARDGRRVLEEAGHQVVTSDLYASRFDPVVTAAEYSIGAEERLFVSSASRRAHETGALPVEIRTEQDRIRAADVLVLQFPLWWFGMPAILKGWIDRVFVEGFAYGVRGDDGRTRRYGDGVLAGKRAQVITTTGGPGPAFGPRGINGELEQLLFPLLHGTLFYAGASVLPPLLIAGADRFHDQHWSEASAALRTRLSGLETVSPLPYRAQHGGDYDDRLVLRTEVAPGVVGLAAHRR